MLHTLYLNFRKSKEYYFESPRVHDLPTTAFAHSHSISRLPFISRLLHYHYSVNIEGMKLGLKVAKPMW
jgi:hypothetical protein